jgi:predicted GH43/DUF377 family glycosyl hydrolase
MAGRWVESEGATAGEGGLESGQRAAFACNFSPVLPRASSKLNTSTIRERFLMWSVCRCALVVEIVGCAIACSFTATACAEPPENLKPWLEPQKWERDTDGPIISLGDKGEFDDTHIFAPTVVRDKDRFLMWYCGSTGNAWDLAPKAQRIPDERIFKLGLATSDDGKKFEKHDKNPVMAISDGLHSILTPCVLRGADGVPIRENGKLRMWYASTVFRGDRVHTVHDATSADGVTWDEPSDVLVKDAYCPSVIKTGDGYQMWYTDVTKFPWVIRYAESEDGHDWSVAQEVNIKIDQSWEHYVLVYPTVIKVDDVYCLWYGSYSDQTRDYTAIGFAVSEDGITWHKHPQNPVLRNDPDRPWESNYVTSESVMRLPDGSFRIWYASRKAPPFKNLYFALNTARWDGPKQKE